MAMMDTGTKMVVVLGTIEWPTLVGKMVVVSYNLYVIVGIVGTVVVVMGTIDRYVSLYPSI